MSRLKAASIFGCISALFLFIAATPVAHVPMMQAMISADEFVQAITDQRTSVIDLYLKEHLNPNARAAQDRPLLLAATLQQDWATVRLLVAANASVDLADESGLTPLMAASMQGNIDMLRVFVGLVTKVDAPDRTGRTALQYAIAGQKEEAVDFLLRFMPFVGAQSGELLASALDAGNAKITGAILNRLPQLQSWSTSTRRVLHDALSSNNRDRVRLLLGKHSVPPTPEGKNVPLLAYAIASHDPQLLTTLLACGADPNTVLPERCDSDFLALLPGRFANYIDGDRDVTALMLAAGVGEPAYLRALLDAGADKNCATGRFKMIPLYLAAQTGKWQCAQVLLGSGPSPEQLRIEISLASQHAAVIKDGVPIFTTQCSTGRSGYGTRTGDYVITDKSRSHRSTIYHVDMPFFMRLSCLDFGMHEGVVPNYPASHGCIRLPGDAARRLFSEIPVGTLVTVK
ncbi:MAG: ankyrin repeat domain-containing protein [Spartobacteria bacterium]